MSFIGKIFNQQLSLGHLSSRGFVGFSLVVMLLFGFILREGVGSKRKSVFV